MDAAIDESADDGKRRSDGIRSILASTPETEFTRQVLSGLLTMSSLVLYVTNCCQRYLSASYGFEYRDRRPRLGQLRSWQFLRAILRVVPAA